MSQAFVTGSSDGIGARIADRLADHGYDVVRHARDERRAEQCRAAGVTDPFVTGDLASLAETRAASRPVTVDGLEQTFQVNALSAYLLTALMPVPRRLVFVSSDSITGARIDLSDLQHENAWTAGTAYADSKLAMTAIAFAVARRYPGALCNAVHPGWISTKMSGDVAPLGLDAGADTAVWLATSTEPAALVTGTFFHEREPVTFNEQADDVAVQDALVARCAELTGVSLHQT
jgi:NAD(P)-dependent dehydrogenase (short-subunit alcohol dehydrogenase family)